MSLQSLKSLPRLWLLVGSDRPTDRPTDRQCHLLSCPGQLKNIDNDNNAWQIWQFWSWDWIEGKIFAAAIFPFFLTNVFHKVPSFIFGISFVVVFAYMSQLYATPLIVIGWFAFLWHILKLIIIITFCCVSWYVTSLLFTRIVIWVSRPLHTSLIYNGTRLLHEAIIALGMKS